jgi:hypothetical protein
MSAAITDPRQSIRTALETAIAALQTARKAVETCAPRKQDFESAPRSLHFAHVRHQNRMQRLDVLIHELGDQLTYENIEV